MEFNFKNFFWALVVVIATSVACTKDDPVVTPDDDKDDQEQTQKPQQPTGITNIVNSYADKKVSHYGSSVSIKFDSSEPWTAELKLITTPETEWAVINENTLSGDAKKGATVRISILKNDTAEERTCELWVTAEGVDPKLVATLTQATSGTVIDSNLSLALNTYMHETLLEKYLWNEEYSKLDVDLTTPYVDFLNKYLLSMGDVNIEDGGRYRMSQENAGERFIYSFISEVQPATKAAYAAGLGFGPFISSALSETSDQMAIAPSYVRPGSPAASIGLRRGDMIYAVNGTMLTRTNYYSYMNALYQNPEGSYSFSFWRYELKEDKSGYELVAYETDSVPAQVHVFDPVLHASIFDVEGTDHKIGYLVYESFEVEAQDFLEEAINEFVSEGITDLILDLRFNVGGAVSQSRWLTGCIAGADNYDKTFVNVVYNDGKTENWKFDYGYNNDADNLGLPTDLGLDRLYVIGSYNTASAAELVINSLRGIDFPVTLIGCKTEGKNVGMNMSETTYGSRRFQFAPITFWVRNAKDFGDYPDGFTPEDQWIVNNDNTLITDDADNVFPYSFSDWGNMDFNIALQWAFCDITGKDRWNNTGTQTKSPSMLPVPVEAQPLKPEWGRYGNLIYDNQN